jgi:subtilisin family serine protease
MRLVVFSCLFLVLGCNKKSNNNLPNPEPLYQEQWAIHYDKPFYDAYNIDPNAHINTEGISYTGRGIKIAIIDFEVDVNHPEFKNNIIHVVNSADGSNDVGCQDQEDCGHGTAVTGIIAANINGYGLRGIAPNAQISFIKLDLGGYTGDDEILAALDYAEKFDVDIISNSWGTEDVSSVIIEKINHIATKGRNGKGVLVVFASGNDGKEVPNDESMLETVIGVGASDEDNLRAIYSNFGIGLDLVPPGGYNLGITTTDYRDDGNSAFLKAEDPDGFIGTSASTPIVSAALALLLEKNPQLTRQQVQQLLKDRTDKIGNVEYIEGHNPYYGFGKLNVGRLLE